MHQFNGRNLILNDKNSNAAGNTVWRHGPVGLELFRFTLNHAYRISRLSKAKDDPI
jgi:hypothetical protein